MRQLTTHELSSMEVINLCDGSKLGSPSCFEVNCEDGRITALLILVTGGFLCFGKPEFCRIPWCKIQCIGEETILVKLTSSELADFGHCVSKKGGRFNFLG